MSPDSAPYVVKRDATIPAAGAAVEQDQVVAEAPFDGTVTGVTLVAEAAVVGDATNNRTFTLVNKGQNGSGNTVVATLALGAGVNLVADDEKAFTLSGVAGATAVADGDELVVNEVHGGTGLAHSGGLIQVEFTRS